MNKEIEEAKHHFAVVAAGLTKNYGQLCAVDHLDLSVSQNSIYGFLGPNGCGKTTAIRMLTGLLLPTSGSVSVLGYELPKNAHLLRQEIGYMTQKFSLYDDLTVYENLHFVADIYNLPARQQKKRIEELLSVYELTTRKTQLAGSMSGGQKQRLALAAATIHSPKLLFLDEPTSAVDPENRREFWERLFDLTDIGTTILVSTHYMDEAERCHKLAILETGIKRKEGAPAELMKNMNANVIEIRGENLRNLKSTFAQHERIISVSQIGNSLRVLVRKSFLKGNSGNENSEMGSLNYVTEIIDSPSDYILSIASPNLEDVFVSCTGGRG